MNLAEVKKSLDKLFAAQPKQGAVRNIVFWYDEDGAFADEVDGLELANAKTIKLYDNNAFAVKLHIEREDTGSNLLVYSSMERPADRDNWLTDIIKYSQTFSTDEASLILLNYKMDISLRPVAKAYKAFFRNNERVRRFDNYGLTDWTEIKLDIAVLSALCKLNVPNFDACIRVILNGVVSEDLSVVESIKKFGSLDRLWTLIEKNYGYAFADRSFEKLAVLLLVTHFAHSFDRALPKAWVEYNAHNTNCFVFVDNFMKDASAGDGYHEISAFVADKLDLPARLNEWTVSDIVECDTFPQFDESIISRICRNILATAEEYNEYKMTINNRRNRRWFEQYETEYDTLFYACELFALFQKYTDFSAADTKTLWKRYRDEYYRFDSYYRKFVLSYDALEQPDDFRKLADMVENAYTNGFLSELAVKWCELLDNGKDANGTIAWSVPDCTEQARFYDRIVYPFVKRDERIVVVISDAFRYESAVEFATILNREHKGETNLNEMLGVIPSYTDLGMAVLLPHKSIKISDKGEMIVNGISSKGTANRNKILKNIKAESVAITFDSLMQMSKAQMTETFGGMKLIYIYHNVIDARGDNASTEREVFNATEKAFKDLSALVRKLRNDISAINILLTADHGYIYRRTPLHESDKTPKDTDGSIASKRRFILTKRPVELQGTQRFSMGYLGQEEITAVVPRGANCFYLQGSGANYVHGGSSLQEVMIPVIHFKSGKNSTKPTAAKQVSLSLTSLSRKVTSVITHLDFFQNEPVGDKRLPLRVKAFFTDAEGNRISNENIIIAESQSKEPAGRTFREKFTLRNMQFDKKQTYYLVMQDDDEMVETEIERFPFSIDLIFGSGIQF